MNGVTYNDPTPPTWDVWVPDPTGVTFPVLLEGLPSIGVRVVNGSNEWFVNGMGSFRRKPPLVVPYIPGTSQFYNKIIIVHEGRHVEQWTRDVGVPGLTRDLLYNATALYQGVLKDMTSTVSEEDLRAQIRLLIDRVNFDDTQQALAQDDLAETDAHIQSNAVTPHYLENF